ncbi:degenerin deg-1-like [Parasteatoda tepidariorum]|uniref:degenerin deg-1-like n=1 Tax=Parasteatoda tepidariorum TaxID=114398 RepID=UPI001C729CE7|nr:FMRFamide-activated amiloride-sensitive sodium channel-like [Parasteatoda tepidariorum]
MAMLTHIVADKIFKKSSIYAIARIGFSKSNYHKIFWLLILIVGLSGCAYKTQIFLSVYFEYPVIVSLQEEQILESGFPAVTICNLNRMKAFYERCINDDIMEKGCRVLINQQVGGQKLGIDSLVKQDISERRSLLSCNGTFNNESLPKLHLIFNYLRMSNKNRRFVGYNASELVKFCSFNMQLCSLKDFKYFQSLRYGNCYTFNSSSKYGNKYIKFSETGYKSGLELLLNLGLNEYTSIASKSGMRISVHHASEAPDPEVNGVDINPGFETSIVLKQMAMQRLPAPYKDRCINYNSRINESSGEECMKLCLQELSFEICGCIDPTLILIPGMKHCNIYNMSDICCLDGVQDNTTRLELSCDCPPSCYAVSYSNEISKSRLSKIGGILSNKSNDNFTNHYARLKVFYSTFTQNTFKQLPTFEESEIFSHLGGELSLWLGLSLFAIFEIMEALISLIRAFKA